MANVAEYIERMTLFEPEYPLPAKVWGLIFRYLRGPQLLTVRLVCRRWKAIVDRDRSLWTKTQITRLAVSNTDVPPPAASVFLRSEKIQSIQSWWSQRGDHLASISLDDCNVTLGALVGMLRHCPNLVRLHLELVTFSCTKEPDVVDFRLDRMEELELVEAHVFDVYIRIFPRLRNLLLDLLKRNSVQTEVRLIASVQSTLESLQFLPDPFMIQKIAEMNDLHLKFVHLFLSNEQNAVELSRLQPSLEEMIMPNWCMSNSSLTQIGRNLPRLRVLTTKLHLTAALKPAFLAKMGQLEILKLMPDGDGEIPINLDGFKCPKLLELSLESFHLDFHNLCTFVNESKHLRRLTLNDCTLDSWTDLFYIIADISSLRCLKLWNSRAKYQLRILPFVPTKLECLLLYENSGLTEEILVQVCKLSPRLQELVLWSMPDVDDATLLKLYRQLPRLARLEIACCAVTAACAGPLLDTCKALQRLRIGGCDALHAALQKLLLGKRGGRYVELLRCRTFSWED